MLSSIITIKSFVSVRFIDLLIAEGATLCTN